MSQTVRIALDAMGGDHGPSVVVAGAALALARRPDSKFLFFGQAEQVAPLLAKYPSMQAASQLVHADVAVRMADKPSQA
jgi:glycerol-3-phosphate acyltransferase PlsX